MEFINELAKLSFSFLSCSTMFESFGKKVKANENVTILLKKMCDVSTFNREHFILLLNISFALSFKLNSPFEIQNDEDFSLSSNKIFTISINFMKINSLKISLP